MLIVPNLLWRFAAPIAVRFQIFEILPKKEPGFSLFRRKVPSSRNGALKVSIARNPTGEGIDCAEPYGNGELTPLGISQVSYPAHINTADQSSPKSHSHPLVPLACPVNAVNKFARAHI
jgi:hypothetical protein